MKKYFIAFQLLFSIISANSQNLVLNSSFEDYWYLPEFYSKEDTFFCKNWNTYNINAADYFHTQSKDSMHSVPNNIDGFHPAHTGKAYVGIASFNWQGYIEYVTGTLSEPLKEGKTYKVSYYTQYAGNISQFYISVLGAYFTKKSNFFYLAKSDPFFKEMLKPDIKAHIKNNENNFLNNDSTWILISGNYKAKGGEKYITIGVFYEEKYDMKIYEPLRNVGVSEKKKKKIFTKYQEIFKLNPNFKPGKFISNVWEYPYYFIDDVSVEEVKDK